MDVKAAVVRFWKEERAQDLIEYALLTGFVAVAAGAVFPNTIMPNVSTIFSRLSSSMNQAS
jgi:Flp pilus assembly pilin Flp